MAAPATVTTKDLTATFVLNKTLSDPTDPILSLQGVGWLIRKAIGVKTITLIIKQSTEADGTVVVDIEQPGVAGIKGTQEVRRIPTKDGDRIWRDHEDHVFGAVKGYSQWTELTDLPADDEGTYLKDGWLPEGSFIESYVESVNNGWTARQVWGFADVNVDGVEQRRYVRRVVVKKGSEIKRGRLVYDFVSA